MIQGSPDSITNCRSSALKVCAKPNFDWPMGAGPGMYAGTTPSVFVLAWSSLTTGSKDKSRRRAMLRSRFQMTKRHKAAARKMSAVEDRIAHQRRARALLRGRSAPGSRRPGVRTGRWSDDSVPGIRLALHNRAPSAGVGGRPAADQGQRDSPACGPVAMPTGTMNVRPWGRTNAPGLRSPVPDPAETIRDRQAVSYKEDTGFARAWKAP